MASSRYFPNQRPLEDTIDKGSVCHSGQLRRPLSTVALWHLICGLCSGFESCFEIRVITPPPTSLKVRPKAIAFVILIAGRP